MGLYDIAQIECLVEYILSNCSYNDIDELTDKIGVDPNWLAQWGIEPWCCEEEDE